MEHKERDRESTLSGKASHLAANDEKFKDPI